MNKPQANAYEFGNFYVDTVKRLLIKGDGESVPLMPRAFDTLLYLVKHAGKVIGKDELLTAIWTDTIVEENNLTQNISTLRRVFGEKHGENRFIATIPGRGYKFVPEVRKKEGSKQIVSGERFAQKSVAVLPFKPLVWENHDESLEMGMADTLIARLGGNNQEVVFRPLAAVRKYGNLEQDPLAAGRELGVDSVLDGCIQRSGEKIRVSVRLIKTADGTSLWAGTFDEKFTDIFAVQDSISERVAAALQIRLGGEKKKRSTENIEAYQLYMKGRFHVARVTPTEIQTGISYFRQAIEIDSSYALAYVGLADAYMRLSIAGELPSTKFFPQSKAAANKAIEIDDTLAEAYVILGWILFWYDWNWNEAEKQCRRALELDPNSADAHEAYAHLLSNTGRHAEGLLEIKRARELSPPSLFINALEGQFLLHARQIDEALDRLRKTFELEPNFWLAHLFAASTYMEKEMFAEAACEANKAMQFSGGSSHAAAFGAYALAKLGKQTEARTALEELLKLSTVRYVPPYHIALIYNGLDEPEETLSWLERGFQERDTKMVFLKVEPKWSNLHSEPRFVDLMKRMKLQQ